MVSLCNKNIHSYIYMVVLNRKKVRKIEMYYLCCIYHIYVQKQIDRQRDREKLSSVYFQQMY